MKRQIPYPHPGEILAEEFLKPMHITPYRLAKEIHADLRLSRFFGTGEGFRSGLQMD